MKDKWQKIINIVILVLLIVCVVRISGMEKELGQLRNTVNNTQSMLQSSINSISSNVRYEMENALSVVYRISELN